MSLTNAFWIKGGRLNNANSMISSIRSTKTGETNICCKMSGYCLLLGG